MKRNICRRIRLNSAPLYTCAKINCSFYILGVILLVAVSSYKAIFRVGSKAEAANYSRNAQHIDAFKFLCVEKCILCAKISRETSNFLG